MYYALNLKKYRRKPTSYHGIPILRFRDRHGRFKPFRAGQWLAPVVSEEALLDLIAGLPPAPKPPKRRKKPLPAKPKARAKPAKPPKKAKKAPPRPVKPLPKPPKAWADADRLLTIKRKQFKGLSPQEKAAAMQGFVYAPPTKPSAKKPDYDRFSIWPTPEKPRKEQKVVGFHLFCVVEPDDYNGRTGKDPFVMTGSVIAWHGLWSEVQKEVYAPADVQGPTKQKVVPWRTKLDVLAMQFYENIGTIREIVAVQPIFRFTGKQAKLVKDYQTKREKERHYRWLKSKAGKKSRKGRR